MSKLAAAFLYLVLGFVSFYKLNFNITRLHFIFSSAVRLWEEKSDGGGIICRPICCMFYLE
jgi:hypothetical protein